MARADGLGWQIGEPGGRWRYKDRKELGYPGLSSPVRNFGYHPKSHRKPSKSVSKRGPRSDLHVTSIIPAIVLKMPKEGQAWRWEATGGHCSSLWDK